MLKVTYSEREVRRLRASLVHEFEKAGAKKQHRRISHPGPSSQLDNARLYWLPDHGVWMHISKAEKHKGRWYCWFGRELSPEGSPVSATVEINLTAGRVDRRTTGRAVASDDGELFLAHKGLLGGGSGGQVSLVDFRRTIRGFVSEPVEHKDGKEESVFVIGRPGDSGFLRSLVQFISECGRLRELARRGEFSQQDRLTSAGANKAAFNPENEKDGTGGGYRNTPAQIKRVHGRVTNALQKVLDKTLGKRAVNSQRYAMKPDLYLLYDRAMSVLFEVKASSDTQSLFTALGQLVVYGAGEPTPPKRVLVCPAIPRDPLFRKAIDMLDVKVVTFTMKGKTVSFDGLTEALSE